MTDEPDDPVGYGKPPRHSQFKKGQSGNPSGRPKGVRSVKADLQDEMTQTVRVTENGKVRKLTKQQLWIKALTTKAAKGDTAAIGKLIKLIQDAYGLGDDANVSNTPLTETDKAIIAAYIAKNHPASTEGGDG